MKAFLAQHRRALKEALVAIDVAWLASRFGFAIFGAGVASAAVLSLSSSSASYHPAFSLSSKGAALITRFEGVRYHPYNDATSPPVCTVGVGHAFRPFHPCSAAEFRETFTAGQVSALLMHDVSWAESCVREHVTHPIDQPQFDALVSFTFNLGCGSPGHGGFWGSSVLAYANAGDTAAVPGRLLLYDHAGAVELPGLKTRRLAEGHLYVTGDYGPGIGRYLPPKPKPVKPTPGYGRCSGTEWPRPARVYAAYPASCRRAA